MYFSIDVVCFAFLWFGCCGTLDVKSETLFIYIQYYIYIDVSLHVHGVIKFQGEYIC